MGKKSSQPKTKITMDEWFEHFSALSKDPDGDSVPLQDSVGGRVVFDLPNRITREMIEHQIRKLKRRKAAGIDAVYNEILIYSASFIIGALETLFNEVLKTRYFPSTWNVVMISPLFKSDDPNDTNNYRGISLLSCLGKLFCSIINEFVYTQVESAHLLSDLQGGFRRKRGCREQSFLLLSALLTANRRRGRRAHCAFVDFRKAYDSVKHSVLWKRLDSLGLGPKLTELLRSIYDKVRCTVRKDNQLSDLFPYDIGVRQGCILSPIIFNLFIDELVNVIQQNSDSLSGIEIGDLVVFILLYADDVVLVADNAADLSSLLRSLQEFCTASGMNVNVKKTKVVIFGKSRDPTNLPVVLFDNKPLEVVNEYKYLGCFVDKDLNFSFHIGAALKRAERASFSLFRCIGGFRNMKVSLKLRLYKTLVLSVLLFNVEVWGHLARKVDLRKLEKFHLSCLRRILMVGPAFPATAVFWMLGVVDLDTIIKQRTIKFLITIKQKKELELFSKTLEHISTFPNKLGTALRNLCISVNIPPATFFPVLFHPPPANRLQKSLESEFFSKTKNLIETNRKLKFLTTFLGSNHGPYPFLELNVQQKIRRSVINFIGGCHHLRIEVGRWYRVPASARVCRLCDSGSLEDELHILLSCPHFSDQREEMIMKLVREEGGLTPDSDDLMEKLRSQQSVKINLGLYQFLDYVMTEISSAHKEDENFRKEASVFVI